MRHHAGRMTCEHRLRGSLGGRHRKTVAEQILETERKKKKKKKKIEAQDQYAQSKKSGERRKEGSTDKKGNVEEISRDQGLGR